MTEQERHSRINELSGQAEPMSLEKIRLSTELHFLERQSDADESRLQMVRTRLAQLSISLAPVLAALHVLQCRYRVVLQGELTDVHGNTSWNLPETRVYSLATNCAIDTDKNGWEPYLNDPCVLTLLSELHDHIHRAQYSTWQALSIVRLP